MKRKEQESEYQKILMERYAPLAKDKLDRTALRALYNDPQEEGYEDEMLEWVKAHPDATFLKIDSIICFSGQFFNGNGLKAYIFVIAVKGMCIE